MHAFFEFVSKNWAVIATILFLVSELVGELPGVKGNSIFGLIRNFLKDLYKKEAPNLPKLDQ